MRGRATAKYNAILESESRLNVDSNDILSVRKYSKLFTHESNTFLGNNTSIRPFKPMGLSAHGYRDRQTDRNTKVKHNIRSLGGYNNNTKSQTSLRRAASPSLTHRITLVTMKCPTFTPENCLFSFDDLHPRLIHPSVDLSHSSPQTATRSNQPFCHSARSGQTDRPTDGLGDNSVSQHSRLRFINCIATRLKTEYVKRRFIVLSHWPRVATHVATQVAAHVASVKGLGHKSLNLLPSPFTLATCAATSLRAAATSGEWN